QDVERLGRGHEDVGRTARHRLAGARRRIARADEDTDLGERRAARRRPGTELGERRGQVLLDVVAERLERRDVDDVRPVLQETALRQPEEAVDRPEEGGERLARAGRRREQRVGSGGDGGPAGGLDRRRLAEAIPEPARDQGRETGHQPPPPTAITGHAGAPRRVASSLARRGAQRLYIRSVPARPASRRSARRAAARAAERAARARPAGPRARAATRIRWLPLGSAVLWWAALAALLGFPDLLAPWLRLVGDDGAHFPNPSIFVAPLVLLLAFARRIFRSRWRALAAVALVTLFPTYIHLWAITPTRDLSAHLAAFLGLYLLLPGGRHRTAAGTALGFAVTIRPDAVLYLVPGGFVLGLEWLRAGARWRRAASTVGAASPTSRARCPATWGSCGARTAT